MQRYDVDGDGHISLEEFSGFLMSRNSEDSSTWQRVDHLAAPQTPHSRNSNSNSNSSQSSRSHPRARRQAYAEPEEEEDDVDSSRGVQYETQLYLQQLRGYLTKHTLDRREAGKISFNERKGHKTSRLIQVQTRSYIRKLFAQYLAPPGPQDLPSAPRGVSLDSFKRVCGRERERDKDRDRERQTEEGREGPSQPT